MSQRARNFLPPQSGGRCRNATEGGRPRAPSPRALPQALRAPPPLPTGISPPRGGEKGANRISPHKQGQPPHRSGIFSPRCAGGDVAERQRGAARAHQAATHPPSRCARPPSALRHLPPKGGRKKNQPPLPAQERMSQRARNFLPPLCGGDVAERQRGGARAHQAATHPLRRCARPPSALRHLPPKGGEKIGGRRHLLPKGGENRKPYGISA